ncbi:MAG: ankyrin repeat domain-containing protein [Parachlamydia sp.]|nr:ankyrin repeat domain-containing protein [Parachlamydia sp.]
MTALVEQVKDAIAAGADVNDNSRNGHRPLQLAILGHCTEVACLLIESGADIKNRDRAADPIHLAINLGEFKVARLLIKKGVNFPYINPDLGYNYSQWYRFRFGG